MDDLTSKPIQKTRLSDLLEGRSPHEAAAILKRWDDAMLTVTYSIPDPEGKAFKVPTLAANGKKDSREIPDELVEDLPELHEWIEAQALAAHLEVITNTGSFKDVPKQLMSDPTMFRQLATARRKYLQSQKKKGAAATKPRPEPGTSSPARSKTSTSGSKPTSEKQTDKQTDKQTQSSPSTPPAAPGATDQSTPDTTA